MTNKEGKEEPWKRGKKGINNKEGEGVPWKKRDVACRTAACKGLLMRAQAKHLLPSRQLRHGQKARSLPAKRDLDLHTLDAARQVRSHSPLKHFEKRSSANACHGLDFSNGGVMCVCASLSLSLSRSPSFPLHMQRVGRGIHRDLLEVRRPLGQDVKILLSSAFFPELFP